LIGPFKRLTSHLDSTREPITLVVLLVLTGVLFAMVGGLSRLHEAKQEAIAREWWQRGNENMKVHKYADAVMDFRTVLLYQRDNEDYVLNLAEALLGDGQINEANAYLTSIWEKQPENGLVNLELAHIAEKKGENESAVRFYHNAIYAVWPSGDEAERRNARFELVELLLRNNDRTQAQAELIALAANVADEPATQVRIGKLFLEAQDNAHALSEFELGLESDQKNAAALAGAGRAAFELGRYAPATRYLQRAVAANPKDKDSASLLRIARLVIEMDPYRQQKKAREREQAVVDAFAVAGKRLTACSTKGSGTERQMLAQKWAGMKPQVTARRLRSNPDMIDNVMALVFRVERQTQDSCGAGSDADAALLLIARNHEGL
jgi:tetratricopeptide (TPR) repeat protein